MEDDEKMEGEMLLEFEKPVFEMEISLKGA